MSDDLNDRVLLRFIDPYGMEINRDFVNVKITTFCKLLFSTFFIFKATEEGSRRQIFRSTGFDRPTGDFQSIGNPVKIKFTSDHSVTFTGFSLSYKIIKPSKLNSK
jgi:hypothetical protein